MKVWNRLGVSQKIGLGLGVIVLFLAGVSGVAWVNLATIDAAASIVTGKIDETQAAETLKANLLDSETLVTAYTLTESDGDLVAAKAGLDRLKNRWDATSASAALTGVNGAELTQSYRAYDAAARSTMDAIGNRKGSSEDFTQAATAITTTTAAVVTTLFRENRMDVLPIGTKLNDIPQAGTVAVARYLATRNPAYADTAKQLVSSLSDSIEALRTAAATSERIQKVLRVLTPQIAAYSQAIDALIAATDASGKTRAERKVTFSHLLTLIAALNQTEIGEQTAAVTTMHKAVTQSRTTIGVLSLIALLVAGFASKALGQSIVTALLKLEPVMHRLAHGNLAVEIPSQDRPDEIGMMARAVHVFKDNMIKAAGHAEQERAEQEARERHIERIMADIRQITAAINEINAAVAQIADGAQTQANAIRQIAVGIRQTAHAIDDVSTHATTSSTHAREAAALVEGGRSNVAGMLGSVHAIAANAKEISRITVVIGRIATQTNMLSLNAAIEAARAGEAGKGFAVVAEEVGKLAEHSGRSASDIDILVEKARTETAQGVKKASAVGANMDRIAHVVSESDQMAASIATAMAQQSAAVEEIRSRIAELAQIGESNATAAEEVTATMVELSRLANQTMSAMDQFRL